MTARNIAVFSCFFILFRQAQDPGHHADQDEKNNKKTPLQDRLSIPLTRRKASASSNSAVAINHTTKRRYHMSDHQYIALCDKRHLIIISLKNPPDLQIETRDYKVADNRKNSMTTCK
jgi:hypothetical protein